MILRVNLSLSNQFPSLCYTYNTPFHSPFLRSQQTHLHSATLYLHARLSRFTTHDMPSQRWTQINQGPDRDSLELASLASSHSDGNEVHSPSSSRNLSPGTRPLVLILETTESRYMSVQRVVTRWSHSSCSRARMSARNRLWTSRNRSRISTVWRW